MFLIRVQRQEFSPQTGLIEQMFESAAVATARQKKIEQEMAEAGLIPPTPIPPAVKKESARDSTASIVSRPASTSGKSTADDEEEQVRQRLESIGMHVGANFSERLCKDRSMFTDTLDIIKFICKDIWAACWDKQIDNMRTNHRGVYVLQDNAFKPITRLSSWDSRAEAIRRARLVRVFLALLDIQPVRCSTTLCLLVSFEAFFLK